MRQFLSHSRDDIVKSEHYLQTWFCQERKIFIRHPMNISFWDRKQKITKWMQNIRSKWLLYLFNLEFENLVLNLKCDFFYYFSLRVFLQKTNVHQDCVYLDLLGLLDANWTHAVSASGSCFSSQNRSPAKSVRRRLRFRTDIHAVFIIPAE